MYKQAFKTYKEIFTIVLIVAIGIPVASLFTNSFGATLIVTALFAYNAHRNILTGEKLGFKNNPNNGTGFSWAFVWRFSMLLIVPLIFATILVFATVGISNESIFILALLAVYLALLGITLSLFGTVLPAASVITDASFSTALKRGTPQFWRTLWKLIYGPVLISTLSVTVMVTLYSIIPNVGIASGTNTIIGVIIGFISGLISAFSTILVATILSQLYLESIDLEAHKSDNLGQ